MSSMSEPEMSVPGSLDPLGVQYTWFLTFNSVSCSWGWVPAPETLYLEGILDSDRGGSEMELRARGGLGQREQWKSSPQTQ